MKMRLIDADVIIDDLTVIQSAFETISIDGMIQGIKDAPTVDPENLRTQGEWISRFARHWKGRDECSRCGFHEKDHRDLSHYNYCPNCGARMKAKGGDA